MNFIKKINQNLVLFFVPVATSFTLGNLPTYAATFAGAEATAFINNFSQTPVSTATDVDVNTFTSATGGSVIASSEANALFIKDGNSFASNSIFSNANGEERNYVGIAENEATVIGNFILDAPNQSFSFDFITNFGLQTEIYGLSGERATAAGEISFLVFSDFGSEQEVLLDSFFLSGKLNTFGKDKFFNYQKTASFTIDENVFFPFGDFGEYHQQEYAQVTVLGSYNRSFETPVNLTLVEKKTAKVTVRQTPESSSSIALLSFGGLIIFRFAKQRQKLSQ